MLAMILNAWILSQTESFHTFLYVTGTRGSASLLRSNHVSGSPHAMVWAHNRSAPEPGLLVSRAALSPPPPPPRPHHHLCFALHTDTCLVCLHSPHTTPLSLCSVFLCLFKSHLSWRREGPTFSESLTPLLLLPAHVDTCKD